SADADELAVDRVPTRQIIAVPLADQLGEHEGIALDGAQVWGEHFAGVERLDGGSDLPAMATPTNDGGHQKPSVPWPWLRLWPISGRHRGRQRRSASALESRTCSRVFSRVRAAAWTSVRQGPHRPSTAGGLAEHMRHIMVVDVIMRPS